MDGEPIPDLIRHFLAEGIHQRFPVVDVQVVHYQVDGLGVRISQCQVDGYPGELKARTIWRGEGKMAPGLRLYGTENIGGPAAFIFVVPARLPAWHSRRGGSHIGVQVEWFLIQADYRLLRVIRPFVHFQDVFHLGNVVFIELGHHPHFFPATA